MTIFVQIAAYRDPELGPTIRDCLAKAARPEQLCFGICLQDDLETDYGIDFDNSQFRVTRVPWQESQGVCWARQLTQALYEGESHTLQIDSHHRFAEHWDDKLLADIKACDSTKPILSTYPGSYDPDSGLCFTSAPNKILISRFDHKGGLKRYPLGYKAKADKRPVPARFIAAGFLFARGEFCEEIPYDPSMYFAGEEPSLTLRAYTNGYDIFHPQQAILWHEYTRNSKPKHWFDHVSTTGSPTQADNKITELEAKDMQRFYKQTQLSDGSAYAMGSARSVHDYQRYAGLDFKHQVVHQRTRLGHDPLELSESEWQRDNERAIEQKERAKSWLITLELSEYLDDLKKVKAGLLNLYDRNQQLIDRISVSAKTLAETKQIEQTLTSSAPPSYWALNGFTHNHTWEQLGSEYLYDYRLLT